MTDERPPPRCLGVHPRDATTIGRPPVEDLAPTGLDLGEDDLVEPSGST
jgi:hypothetical protein